MVPANEFLLVTKMINMDRGSLNVCPISFLWSVCSVGYLPIIRVTISRGIGLKTVQNSDGVV